MRPVFIHLRMAGDARRFRPPAISKLDEHRPLGVTGPALPGPAATVPEGLKGLLSGLRAVHDTRRIYTPDAQRRSEGAIGNSASMRRSRPDDQHEEAVHPVVRTHPETGRKALYVNCNFTSRFEDMSEAESVPLLDFLFAHLQRPEFTCRFRWSRGAVALWDNRCTQHYALNDYHGHRRVMHRISIEGDRPA